MIDIVDPEDFVGNLTPEQTAQVMEACWQNLTERDKQGNPRFDRGRFLEACETGTTRGMGKAQA